MSNVIGTPVFQNRVFYLNLQVFLLYINITDLPGKYT